MAYCYEENACPENRKIFIESLCFSSAVSGILKKVKTDRPGAAGVKGERLMPAMITHYLFAQRVMAKCRQAGIPIADRDAALIGAQGPDIFFFHRVMPWQRGVSYARQGSLLHKRSPARLFEAFRAVLNRETAQREQMLGYVEGFFCHYALDRSVHPFVYYWQEQLHQEDPGYGKNGHAYHFRIESALDTIALRRETGRLIRDFRLKTVLPEDENNLYLAVGRLYRPVFDHLLGLPGADAKHIALAPGDMRRAAAMMTDRSLIRQRLLETIGGQGHIATSLLRPAKTDDWDYANESRRQWANPYDEKMTSRDSFFDLYELAADEAVTMIGEFLEALPEGKSMLAITQDRGFSSDLPGIYTEK